MAKNKIKRIDQEIAKVREKITEYQDKLKPLEAQKTEAENLEIIQTVRAAADPGAAFRHALRRHGSRHGCCFRRLQRTGGYRP